MDEDLQDILDDIEADSSRWNMEYAKCRLLAKIVQELREIVHNQGRPQ